MDTKLVKWYWRSGPRKFTPYSSKEQELLENYFKNYESNPDLNHIIINIGVFSYSMDFKKFQQTNIKTNKSREIRRIEIKWNISDIPINNISLINQLENAYLLNLNIDIEYNEVKYKFYTDSMELVNIEDESEVLLIDRIEKINTEEDIETETLVMNPDKLNTSTSLGKDPSKKEIEDFVKSITNCKIYTKEQVEKLTHTCPICLIDLNGDDIVVEICGNDVFHLDCLCICTDTHNGFLKCPLCSKLYGIRKGNMPAGVMSITRDSMLRCSGYNCGTIVITYSFSSGVQRKEHPHPGVGYEGTYRTAYLPDNKEGNYVLSLFKIAWERRLLFTVGQSVTTGIDNCVIWNGIHHKTCVEGGFSNFGYPDETYFHRVVDELKDKGVTLPYEIEFDESTRCSEEEPLYDEYDDNII